MRHMTPHSTSSLPPFPQCVTPFPPSLPQNVTPPKRDTPLLVRAHLLFLDK